MNKPITHCLLCERALEFGFGWKELLRKTLPRAICNRCESKFERIENQQETGIFSLFYYNEAMKDFLHRYKFMHDVLLAHVFNEILHQHLKNEKRLIIPIPMHTENLKVRTFAHVEELLNAAKIPFEHHLTKRSSDIQSLKTRDERLQTAQLFDVIDCSKVKGRNILLIDDIYTTGTTMLHAKKVLENAGAIEVSGFTLIHS